MSTEPTVLPRPPFPTRVTTTWDNDINTWTTDTNAAIASENAHQQWVREQTPAAIGAIPASTGTAKGDLIGFSGAATPTRLGIGAEGQVPRVSSAAATGIAWGDAPNDNLVVGGNFDFWFEGTSQTSSGYGSDTMSLNQHVGSSGTHSRLDITADEVAAFDDYAQYGSRTAVTSVAGASNYKRKVFRFENVRQYSGRKCVFSFRGRASASDKPVAVEAVQCFGTGGSPSADVTSISPQIVTLGTTFTKKSVILDLPSISGKTLGTNENSYLDVIVWYDAGSSFASRTASIGQQSGTFDLAQVKLERGEIATPFVAPDPQQELARVQRYYEVGDGSGWPRSIDNIVVGTAYYKVTKRATPTPILTVVVGPTTCIGGISTSYFRWTGAATSNILSIITWTADARL